MQQANVNEINVISEKQEESIVVKETVYEKPLSYLEWVGSVFLLTIPIVNIFSSIVFILLRGKSKDRSNYVIASLVITVSTLIMTAIVLFVFKDYIKDVVFDLWETMP
jgi:hypothetical protein